MALTSGVQHTVTTARVLTFLQRCKNFGIEENRVQTPEFPKINWKDAFYQLILKFCICAMIYSWYNGDKNANYVRQSES